MCSTSCNTNKKKSYLNRTCICPKACIKVPTSSAKGVLPQLSIVRTQWIWYTFFKFVGVPKKYYTVLEDQSLHHYGSILRFETWLIIKFESREASLTHSRHWRNSRVISELKDDFHGTQNCHLRHPRMLSLYSDNMHIIWDIIL